MGKLGQRAGPKPVQISKIQQRQDGAPILFQSVMFPSVTISLTIRRPFAAVYTFLSTPANLNEWINGVIERPLERLSDYHWQAQFDGEEVELHFTPPNVYGVLDLRVSDDRGTRRQYWVRVLPNDDGAELSCTILQVRGETDAQFASECEWLRTDLNVLRNYIETH
ncbi:MULTISPECIES: hypothetical protein [unclassified Devosia]|uniref:hypothetical protein n=1 Tax=unclassified Devosia TaxID=196773 RepID=UPI000713F9CA|nr:MULTISPECIES: hypothetical protein [unclassified Devosia]KQN76800.1 hypothetical protein ASE94_17845 [Devosia sp. Leaf64]